MQTYRPRPPPANAKPEQLAEWMFGELQNIQKAANDGNDSVRLRYLTSGPARPQDGALYAFDATNPNAGSGTGVYRYTAAAATYTFLG